LTCGRWALGGPENVRERLEAATEILGVARQVKSGELALGGRHWRLQSLLELGDIVGVDAEMNAHARLAIELRQPLYLWFSALWKAMRALLEGRFDEAERLAADALAIGERAKAQNPERGPAGQGAFVRGAAGRRRQPLP